MPVLLRKLAAKLNSADAPKGSYLEKVVAIVHNAGIYNGIFAAGLAWSAVAGESANDVARVLLAGAAVAGVFGAATLKSPVPVVQAAVGVVGLYLL